MKLAVIGTGYIGIVGAAVFADWGNTVMGVDIDEAKIKQIKSGEMPIFEPGLKELVMENIDNGRLNFTTSLAEGIKEADIVFICVGTPQSDDGAADLSAVWAVAKEIGKHLSDYKVIVTKSTVPVGTNERVKELVTANLKEKTGFDVVSNPEFLREGFSIEDMQNTDRTVIGFETEKARDIMRKLYDHLESPIVECDLRSSEMIKYASNAFLATKISFINEIGQLCERAGANVQTVAKGMGLDDRIGPRFLFAGVGYGGSCFPKDVAALYKTSTDQAYDFKLLRGVMEVNDLQKHNFFKKIRGHFGENLSGKTFASLGLSFKNKTDDTRESVSIDLVQMFRGNGAQVNVFDPEAMDNARAELGEDNITYAKDMYEAIDGADALVILTEWGEFRELDLKKVKGMLKSPVIFDGRNLLDQAEVEEAGFTYYAIGKPTNGLGESDYRPNYAILRSNGHD